MHELAFSFHDLFNWNFSMNSSLTNFTNFLNIINPSQYVL